jgi:hypothetical protein
VIEILEGFGLGAGKSYTTIVAKLIPHFCRGGTAYVVDTMEVLWPELQAHCYNDLGYKLHGDQLYVVPEAAIPTLHEHTPPGTDDCPVLIVADEVHGKLNARDWNDKNKRGLFEWATQSRHDDNDLWLISQSAMNIDKQMRRLATYNWRVRNTLAMGENVLKTMLSIRSAVTFGLLPKAYFILTQLDQDGKTAFGKKRWLEQDQRIFKCYRSKAMRGKHKRAGEPVARKVIERRKARHPMIKYVLIGMVAVIGFGAWKLWTTPKPSFLSANATPAPVPAEVQHVAAKEGVTTYEVRTEVLRTRSGTYVATMDGEYEVGRITVEGRVRALDGNVIVIDRPGGRVVYVLASRAKYVDRPAAVPSASPKTEATKK